VILTRTLRTAAITAALMAATQLMTVAHAIGPARYLRPVQRAEWSNWHGNYAHTAYGRQVALVVPPTAQLQTNWSWGVGSSSITRIDHQFTRNFQGSGGGGAWATPHWPRSTRQMGVYYVRGPWYPTQP
jgi:hypothetical protein